eukprot:8319659-Alexandrium_andersonii.AAC.1
MVDCQWQAKGARHAAAPCSAGGPAPAGSRRRLPPRLPVKVEPGPKVGYLLPKLRRLSSGVTR